MNALNFIADAYERKARLYPALLLVAPVVATAVAIISAKLSGFQSLGTSIVGCGGAFLLTQLARDAGKKGEPVLLQEWGGLPSVAILRHRDMRIDSITKARYHKKLSTLVKGANAPNAEQEQADPTAADTVYTAWSTYVRVNTRDTKKYPLLFQENVSYGYRRNVWGLRLIGIVTTTICFVIAVARIYQLHKSAANIPDELLAALTFTFIVFLLWVFRFTPDWVRIPADAYAARLAEAVDTLGSKPTAAKK